MEQLTNTIDCLKQCTTDVQDAIDKVKYTADKLFITDEKDNQTIAIDLDDKTVRFVDNHLKILGNIGRVNKSILPNNTDKVLPLEQSIKKLYFITLNVPRDQKIRLNKKHCQQWQTYKTKEQKKILDRVIYYFEEEYMIYYEFTKESMLHLHCIYASDQSARDIKIDLYRFFNIPHTRTHFIDVRLVTDLKGLQDYLEEKKVKTYQTSGIKPEKNITISKYMDINKPI